MGEVGGFLKIEKHTFQYSDPAKRVGHVKEFIERNPAESSRSRARAAWSAACRSATTAARSAT